MPRTKRQTVNGVCIWLKNRETTALAMEALYAQMPALRQTLPLNT